MIELLNSNVNSNLTLITNIPKLQIQNLFEPVKVAADCDKDELPNDWYMEDRPKKAIVNYHNFVKMRPKAPPEGICVPQVESKVTKAARFSELFKKNACN